LDLGLRGKTALITGGSRGIGAATAEVLASEGCNLILVARDALRLDAVRDKIRAAWAVDIENVVCDLSDGARIEALASAHRNVDILINNAGEVPGGSLLAVNEEQWRTGWDSKVFAYINMSRAFYPILKERGGGAIINVLGVGSRQKRFDYICGGMGNAALDFFTECLGGGSPKDNIRVVGISPGRVDTDRYHRLSADRNVGHESPFGRLATPQEIGVTIAFAASSRSAYTSGAIIVVDGGLSVAR